MHWMAHLATVTTCAGTDSKSVARISTATGLTTKSLLTKPNRTIWHTCSASPTGQHWAPHPYVPDTLGDIPTLNTPTSCAPPPRTPDIDRKLDCILARTALHIMQQGIEQISPLMMQSIHSCLYQWVGYYGFQGDCNASCLYQWVGYYGFQGDCDAVAFRKDDSEEPLEHLQHSAMQDSHFDDPPSPSS